MYTAKVRDLANWYSWILVMLYNNEFNPFGAYLPNDFMLLR